MKLVSTESPKQWRNDKQEQSTLLQRRVYDTKSALQRFDIMLQATEKIVEQTERLYEQRRKQEQLRQQALAQQQEAERLRRQEIAEQRKREQEQYEMQMWLEQKLHQQREQEREQRRLQALAQEREAEQQRRREEQARLRHNQDMMLLLSHLTDRCLPQEPSISSMTRRTFSSPSRASSSSSDDDSYCYHYSSRPSIVTQSVRQSARPASSISATSTATPARSKNAWNDFQHANVGRGWTRKQMQDQYRKSKR